MEDRVFSLLYTPHLLPDPIARRTLRLRFNTAAMEARATNPIYETGDSHPCSSALPQRLLQMEVGTEELTWCIISEFTSKEKLVWGLLLPTITNRLHRPFLRRPTVGLCSGRPGQVSPDIRSMVVGFSNPEQPQPQPQEEGLL